MDEAGCRLVRGDSGFRSRLDKEAIGSLGIGKLIRCILKVRVQKMANSSTSVLGIVKKDALPASCFSNMVQERVIPNKLVFGHACSLP